MSEVTALQSIVSELVKVKEQHGEQITTTILETTSLVATNDLIQSFVGVIFSAVIIWWFLSSIKNIKADGMYGEPSFFQFMKTFFGGVISFFCFIMFVSSISTLINPVVWKGVSKPEVYLTYQLLKKAK
jgi:divalent metal cation (Fe/Co/Zn/Cd) transporter